VPMPQAEGAPEGIRLPARATYGQVFAVGEFRALWLAQVLSVAGDQLARVALTLLVFDRTHSALLAAVTFAASVVPTFLGGTLLSGLADRLPRREVMIVCDLSRAALVALMMVPGMSVTVLVCLLFLVTMLGPLFTSARTSLYHDILPEDRFVLGTAVTITTLQLAQALGFALGGAVVGLFGVRISLGSDAATFVLSAVIARAFVRSWPSHGQPTRAPISLSGLSSTLGLVFRSERLRTPMLFGWLAALYNVPEGVAAPLAASLHGGAVAVGAILAASALGAAVGAILFSRLVQPKERSRWTGPLAATACAVLVLFVFRPLLPLAIMILVVSGLGDSYQIPASADFVTAAPASLRSQTFGIAQGGMSLGQGTTMILAGAAAQHFSPSAVVSVTGAVGTGLALLLAALRGRAH
jgi:Major Facilitator Superfamily